MLLRLVFLTIWGLDLMWTFASSVKEELWITKELTMKLTRKGRNKIPINIQKVQFYFKIVECFLSRFFVSGTTAVLTTKVIDVEEVAVRRIEQLEDMDIA